MAYAMGAIVVCFTHKVKCFISLPGIALYIFWSLWQILFGTIFFPPKVEPILWYTEIIYYDNDFRNYLLVFLYVFFYVTPHLFYVTPGLHFLWVGV